MQTLSAPHWMALVRGNYETHLGFESWSRIESCHEMTSFLFRDRSLLQRVWQAPGHLFNSSARDASLNSLARLSYLESLGVFEAVAPAPRRWICPLQGMWQIAHIGEIEWWKQQHYRQDHLWVLVVASLVRPHFKGNGEVIKQTGSIGMGSQPQAQCLLVQCNQFFNILDATILAESSLKHSCKEVDLSGWGAVTVWVRHCVI